MATLDERISALVDDELAGAEVKTTVQHILDDSAAISCWDRYHLIGDVLRHGQPTLGRSDLPQRVHTSLLALPTTLRPKQWRSWHKRPWRGTPGVNNGVRHLAGLAVAASVTVIAVLGARQLSEATHSTVPDVVRAPVPTSFATTTPAQTAGWQGNLPYTMAEYSTGSYTADDMPGVQHEILGILPYAALVDVKPLERAQ